jgi:hypothetical protein
MFSSIYTYSLLIELKYLREGAKFTKLLITFVLNLPMYYSALYTKPTLGIGGLPLDCVLVTLGSFLSYLLPSKF